MPSKSNPQGRYQFKAVLPPKVPGMPTRVRFYRAEHQARTAQRQAWARFTGRVRKPTTATDHRFRQCNRTEQGFIAWAGERGVEIHRGGWPDFLVRTPKGQIVAVEVKSRDGTLSPSQIQCIQLLSQAGVETWVYRPGFGLEHWKKFVKEWPARESGCLSGQTSHETENAGQERPDPRDATLAPDERSPGADTTPRLH